MESYLRSVGRDPGGVGSHFRPPPPALARHLPAFTRGAASDFVYWVVVARLGSLVTAGCSSIPVRSSLVGSRRNATVARVATIPATAIAARGELSAAMLPPRMNPIAGHSAFSEPTALIKRPCNAAGVSCWTALISDGHWM